MIGLVYTDESEASSFMKVVSKKRSAVGAYSRISASDSVNYGVSKTKRICAAFGNEDKIIPTGWIEKSLIKADINIESTKGYHEYRTLILVSTHFSSPAFSFLTVS